MISVIIPTYNRYDLLENCLSSIRAHCSKSIEIIVVDNGSKNISLTTIMSDCIYLKLKNNLGFAKACNLGAKIAAEDFLLFLNNDTIADNDFITPMLEAFTTDVGVVGSMLLYPDGSIQHSGIDLYKDANGDLQGLNLKSHESSSRPKAVTGACMAVRKKAFVEVGGFDENYWNGNEDVDLCMKMKYNYWSVRYEPKSRLTHLESQSGPERFRMVNHNVAYFNQKWNH